MPQHPSHIAMFSIPAHGHVQPNLDVIRELVDRGHRVSYALPDSFADLVAATGAEHRPWTSVLPIDENPQSWGPDVLDHLEPFLDDAVQALPQLAAAYEGDTPDLVLHDSAAFSAPLLAHRWGVPAIQLTPHMVAWGGYEEEVGKGIREEVLRTERGRAHYARFRAWLEEHGVPGVVEPDFLSAHPARAIVLIPRAMQPNADRVDASIFTFVGSCQGDRSAQGDWRRPAGLAPDAKVLLVSLGSVFTDAPEVYRACIEEFGGRPDWHVVLQIGKFTDPAVLGEIPDNVAVHTWVPQLAILRQADMFVTHAGMGGSQEGLANGVPMVCVPQAADQFMNADTLERLGVARQLANGQVTARALGDAVRSLIDDPDVAATLRRIRAEMAGEGGSRRAADLIEAQLPQG
ncbi:macrolide family glycosyltransferase [Streptomyces yunnanensis]|uniref:Glycosyltransferase, MGT family n=1 Tax=Streptomyces yunnanensis TaxID=156453 RepID=A0A9X8N7K5_9ACTN|nr:macrolide family glycosyltransferase [Streptomyces yunnanensis]SHN22816.1 glycosyltransferase, MGT family [Streptomyces yunnanensis]